MTEEEALHHMREKTPMDQVRAVLSSVIGAAEQAELQSHPPTPIERRIAEYRGVERVLAKAAEVGLVMRQ